MASALMRVQSLYGAIPNVTAIGANAISVAEMMVQQRAESAAKEPCCWTAAWTWRRRSWRR